MKKDSLRILDQKDGARMSELLKDMEMRFTLWEYKSAFEEF